MPTGPTVFRPIKSNDVQLRPFKAYKRYAINSNSTYSASGYRVHNALHNIYPIHVGDSTYNYPLNAIDGTNQHAIWKSIDHRYFRYPYDTTKCHEHTNINITEKYLHYSASILTIPYFQVGERIKPGSVTLTSKPIDTTITLYDDGNGNLRDSYISTSSFASASNLIFYMSFNDEYRRYDKQFGLITTSSIKYTLNKQQLYAKTQGSEIVAGVTDSINNITGVGIRQAEKAYTRVPHDDTFNKFNRSDKWTISFWYYIDTASVPINTGATLLSKYASTQKIWINKTNKKRSFYDSAAWQPTYTVSSTAWKTRRTPFHFELVAGSSNQNKLQFRSSDGINSMYLTGSWGTLESWHHCAVVNNGALASLYIDGVKVDSGSLPPETTSNSSYVMIGNYSHTSSLDFPIRMDEIRMYDYNVPDSVITSLSNNHYLSGSLYQTNVAGNVFYRNGQIVVSSPLQKYNSGSGFFNNEWTASWKGTHTIYENEVMVRIPSDQFNYSLNPTATFRPVADGSGINTTIENRNGPGVLFKSMFTSSFISPYITTIGLYNDKAQLLAVGKLAQPVQKRDDVDMNIIVRWDY
jgi:hypothetical protein